MQGSGSGTGETMKTANANTPARADGTEALVGRVEVTFDVVARTIADRLYALLVFSALGLTVAILGRAGATIKSGKEISITVRRAS